MTTSTATTGVDGLLPPEYGALVVEPVLRDAVAAQVSTVRRTNGHAYHVPVLREDYGASWVSEGEEIDSDDGVWSELVTVPSKVAGLAVITRELADDSSPAAQTEVGRSLSNSIRAQVDNAFFGNLPAPAPSGLAALEGTLTVDAGDAWANLDAFATAESMVQSTGAAVTAWVANPGTALQLTTLKDEDGSNRPLLGMERITALGGDGAAVPVRTIFGAPLLTSPAVELGTVWGIPRERSLFVLNEDVTVAVSNDAYFSSDRVGVRATMRVGFCWPSPGSVVRVSLTS